MKPVPQDFVVFVNTAEVGGDGWAQLAPWGDYHGMAAETQVDGTVRRFKAVQRLDAAAGLDLVNEFRTNQRRLGKFPVGLDIYEGHPDSPSVGHRWPDKAPRGTICDLEVRESGLYGRPIFNNAGAAMLAKPQKVGFSTRWIAVQTDRTQPIFRPRSLLSVGLTPNPNLPVEMLNECEQAGEEADRTKEHAMNREKILAWLKGQGVELANDASDAQIEQGLESLGSKLKGLPAIELENVTLKATQTELSNERDTLKTQMITLTTERDAARTEFTNERAAHVEVRADLAIREGRITQAQRDEWKGRLTADFSNAVEAIEKLKVLKTAPAERKTEVSNAAETKTGIGRVTQAIESALKK